jgi:hypothetical protein
VKVSVTGSAGGHNGVASLLEHLGDGFVRYSLGHRAQTAPQMDIKDFVLGSFTLNNVTLLTQKLDRLVDGLGASHLGRSGARDEPTQSQRPKMNPTKRSYRATFILDNRGKEDSIDQIIDGVKQDIAAIQGEVTAVENLGTPRVRPRHGPQADRRHLRAGGLLGSSLRSVRPSRNVFA